jgi:hypothetical protein
LRLLRDGDIVGIDPGSSVRQPDGTWSTVRISVLDAKGRERVFTLRKVSDERVEGLLGRMEMVGATSSPTYAPAGLLHVPEVVDPGGEDEITMEGETA